MRRRSVPGRFLLEMIHRRVVEHRLVFATQSEVIASVQHRRYFLVGHVLVVVLLVHAVNVVVQQVHLVDVQLGGVQTQHRPNGIVVVLFQMMRFVFVVLQRCFLAGTVAVVDIVRGALVRGSHEFLLFVFESLLSSQIATVFEHVTGLGVQAPEGALPRFVGGSRNFDEAIVERQRMPD